MSTDKKFILYQILIEILAITLGIGIGWAIWGNNKEEIIVPRIEFNDLFVGEVHSIFTPDVQVLGMLVGDTEDTISFLIKCESGGNPNAIGKAGEIGILQYLPSTWKYFNELRETDLDIYNSEHQIDMLKWALRNDLEFHWSCWSKL